MADGARHVGNNSRRGGDDDDKKFNAREAFLMAIEEQARIEAEQRIETERQIEAEREAQFEAERMRAQDETDRRARAEARQRARAESDERARDDALDQVRTEAKRDENAKVRDESEMIAQPVRITERFAAHNGIERSQTFFATKYARKNEAPRTENHRASRPLKSDNRDEE